MTTLASKEFVDITQNKKSLTKVLNLCKIRTLTYGILFFLAIFVATACNDNTNAPTPVASTLTPVVAIIANVVPTVRLTQATISSTQTAPRLATATLLATPSPTPSVYPTLPLATPAPTLSLLDVLTQTIVVSDHPAFSIAASVYLPLVAGPVSDTLSNRLAITLSSTLSSTAVITDPTAQIDGQTGPNAPMRLISALPNVQSDGLPRTVNVPILMYHYLGTPPANADVYRRDLSVAPDLFAAQLDRMQAEGYSIISLYDLTAHLLQGVALPEKSVVLSFDDGYRDNYENAYPLLRDRQLTATFFIVTDFIDRERPEYLTWDMVREMYAGGMSIEVHGVDHTTLRGRTQADLEYQALRSYETIRDRIGIRPRFLSYPAGEFDNRTIDMFRSADYWAAVTTRQGVTQSSDKLFELQRIRIRATTTPDDLIRLLELDW